MRAFLIALITLAANVGNARAWGPQPLSRRQSPTLNVLPGGNESDDTHRSRRIGLCPCDSRQGRQRDRARGEMQKFTRLR